MYSKAGACEGSYSDCGQQPFRHIGHNDADEEDDSLQPRVTQDESQDEKRDSEENGHAGDDMDEVLDFFGDGGFAGLQARGQGSNATHYSAVSCADDDATGCACLRKGTQIISFVKHLP